MNSLLISLFFKYLYTMKFNNLLYDLIVEASKKDILIQKIGLNERNAEFLSNLCGPLSVFMANKLFDNIIVDTPRIKKNE